MNTLFFKYALEVNRTRSITKAAGSLYMQQPNLSKAIKEMEELLCRVHDGRDGYRADRYELRHI